MAQTDKDTMALLVLCLALLIYQASATVEENVDKAAKHNDKDTSSSYSLPTYSDERPDYPTVARVIPLKDYINVLKNIPVFRSAPYIKKVPVWQHVPLLKDEQSHLGHFSFFKQVPTADHTPVLDHVSMIEKVPIKLIHYYDDTSHAYSFSKHSAAFETDPTYTQYVHDDGIETGTGLPYDTSHDVEFDDDDSVGDISTAAFKSGGIFNHGEIGHVDLLDAEPKHQIESIEHYKESDGSPHSDLISTHETSSPILVNKKHVSKSLRYPVLSTPFGYGKYSSSHSTLQNKKNCGQRWIPITKYGQKIHGYYGSSYLSNIDGQYNRVIGTTHELENSGYKLEDEHSHYNLPEIDEIKSVDHQSVSLHDKILHSHEKHEETIGEEIHDDGDDDHSLHYNHNKDLSSEDDDYATDGYEDDHSTDDDDDTSLLEEHENVHDQEQHTLDDHLIHKHKDTHLVNEHEEGHIVHNTEAKHAISEHLKNHQIHDFKREHHPNHKPYHADLANEHKKGHIVHNIEDKHAISDHLKDHQIHDFKGEHHPNHKPYHADLANEHKKGHIFHNNEDKHAISEHLKDHQIHDFKGEHHPNHKPYQADLANEDKKGHIVHNIEGKHAISEHLKDHHIHDFKGEHHPNHKPYHADLDNEHDDHDYTDQHSHLHNHDHTENSFAREDHSSEYEQSEHESHSHEDHSDSKQHNEDRSQESHEAKRPEYTPSHNPAHQPSHQQYEDQKHIDNDYENQHDKEKHLQNNHKQFYKETDKNRYEQKLEKPNRLHNQEYQESGKAKQHSKSTKGRILHWYFRKYHGKRFNNQDNPKIEDAPQAPYSKRPYEEKPGSPQVYAQMPEKHITPQFRKGHKDATINFGDRIKLNEYKKPAITTSNQHEFNLYQYENENEKTNPKYDTKIDLSSSDAPKHPPKPQFPSYNTDNAQHHRTRNDKYGKNYDASKSGGVQSQYFRKYHQGVGSQIYGGEYPAQRNPNNQNSRNYQTQQQSISHGDNRPSPINRNVQPRYRQVHENPNSEQYFKKSLATTYIAGKGFPQQSKSSYYGRDHSNTGQIFPNTYSQGGQFRPITTNPKTYGKDVSKSSIENKRGIQENYFRKYHQGLGAPIHGGHINLMANKGGTNRNLRNSFISQSTLNNAKNSPKTAYAPIQQEQYDVDDNEYDNGDLLFSNGPLIKTEYKASQHHSSHHRNQQHSGNSEESYKLKQQSRYSYPTSPSVQGKYDAHSDGVNPSGLSLERGLKSNYFLKYHLGLGAPIHGGNYNDSGDLRTSSNGGKKA